MRQIEISHSSIHVINSVWRFICAERMANQFDQLAICRDLFGLLNTINCDFDFFCAGNRPFS